MKNTSVLKKAKSICSTFLCVVILMTAVLPLRVSAEDGRPQTIRVGFFAFDGYHEMDENGTRSGYGYDFLSLLRRYSNLNYEYVGYDKSWSDMQQMLLDGEIDMVTSAHRTPEREELFEFSLPIGSNNLTISTRSDETRFIEGNYDTYDGMMLGLIEGSSSNSKVEEFAHENHFSFNARYYADSDALEAALKKGEVDAVAASSLRRTSGEKTIAEFNTEYFYAIVKKGNTALIDEINQAIVEMNSSEGDWMSSLFYKNYDAHNYSGLSFTQAEKDFIAAHSGKNNPIIVAFDNDWAPFSKKEGNSYTGVMPDYWNKIAEMTGLEFTAYGYDSDFDIEANLINGQSDIFIGYRSNPTVSEAKGVVESSPLLDAGACLISIKGSNGNEKIGVSAVNPRLNELFNPDSGQLIVTYRNSSEAIEGLEKGDVDKVFLYAYEGEYILNNDISGRLSYSIVPDISVSLCVVASETEDHTLIGIVSKCINAMADTDVNTIIAKNMTVNMGRMSVGDYMKLHPLASILSAVGLAILVGAILFFVYKNRVEKQHGRVLEEKVSEISDLNTHLLENQVRLEESSAEQEAQLEEITALNGQLEENQARLEEVSAEQEAQLEENELLNKRLQDALKQAEQASQAKSNFLFSMSHDIRTPMNAIIGYANLMKTHSDDKFRCMDYLDKILGSSDILLDIINNVLEMARIESGKMPVKESTRQIASFYNELEDVFEESMRAKGIHYTRSVDIQHEYVMCDSVKLREIILNIISNAGKYTKEGGSVNVELKEMPSDRDGYALMQTTVTDTGIGMSKGFIPHIFDEFSREKTVTENKIPGTGLGMPIVRKLVDLLGGTIEVDSSLGQGTTFVVSLYHRISDAGSIGATETESNSSVDFNGKRVLLAEDNDLNAEIAATILEDMGIIVDRAADGLECVSMIESNPSDYYELVLMDIQMPNLNGYEAAKRIRSLEDSQKAIIPIAAMTANAFEEDRQNALAAGMNEHLAKPIEIPKLIQLLERFL